MRTLPLARQMAWQGGCKECGLCLRVRKEGAAPEEDEYHAFCECPLSASLRQQFRADIARVMGECGVVDVCASEKDSGEACTGFHRLFCALLSDGPGVVVPDRRGCWARCRRLFELYVAEVWARRKSQLGDHEAFVAACAVLEEDGDDLPEDMGPLVAEVVRSGGGAIAEHIAAVAEAKANEIRERAKKRRKKGRGKKKRAKKDSPAKPRTVVGRRVFGRDARRGIIREVVGKDYMVRWEPCDGPSERVPQGQVRMGEGRFDGGEWRSTWARR